MDDDVYRGKTYRDFEPAYPTRGDYEKAMREHGRYEDKDLLGDGAPYSRAFDDLRAQVAALRVIVEKMNNRLMEVENAVKEKMGASV